MKSKLRNQKGFTIIEVLIVLAIAGLILLIVFLAVPALQRNSRNTQRKNDVAAVLGAAAEFSNNNNGTTPTGTWTNTGGKLTLVGAAGSTSSEAKVGYYNLGVVAAAGNVTYIAAGTVTAGSPGAFVDAAHDYVQITYGTECSGNASVKGSARSITAIYAIENGSGSWAQVCQSS